MVVKHAIGLLLLFFFVFVADAKSEAENPFSFKKFLKGDTKSKSGGLTTLDLANDLPDFVHGHYSPAESASNSRPRQPAASEIQLPDFALELDSVNKDRNSMHNQFSDNDVVNLPPLGLDNPLHSGIVPAAAATADNNTDNDTDFSAPSAGLGLPDFLSDSALNNLPSGLNNGLTFSDDDDEDDDESDVTTELKRVRIISFSCFVYQVNVICISLYLKAISWPD